MRQTLLTLVVVGLVSAGAGPGNAAESSGDFRVEFQTSRHARGVVVEGYVHSPYSRATDRMVLRIERLDASGRIVGASRTWVAGGTPTAGRAYFSARVAEANAYRVLVESFDWQRCGDW
jgi:hypothetical protein